MFLLAREQTNKWVCVSVYVSVSDVCPSQNLTSQLFFLFFENDDDDDDDQDDDHNRLTQGSK